jgi:penicillin-binding protein 1A
LRLGFDSPPFLGDKNCLYAGERIPDVRERALALSQVTTRPDAVKTQFNPAQDQAEVVSLLQAGCAHMRKVFAIEDINLDDLITTAMDDPQVMSGGIKALHGLKFDELFTAYRQFCKNETVEHSPVDIGDVIAFYNKAVADLPDHTKLKDLRLPGLTVVLDSAGSRFAEVGEPDHRRIWVPLIDIPTVIQHAFVAAEDKQQARTTRPEGHKTTMAPRFATARSVNHPSGA